MFEKCSIGAVVLAAMFISSVGAQAQQSWANTASQYDPSRYPDWSGPMRFTARGGNRYDQTKPSGRAQEAPLTPEYRAIFEAGLRDQAAGGQGGNQTFSCFPGGMPREMAGNQALAVVVTPK